jgi:hypothetical protein
MANPALLYENKADSGTLTASSWIASAPPSVLQNHHVRRRWMGRDGDTEQLVLDFGALTSIDTIALFGLAGFFSGGAQRNLSENCIRRVRVSTVDPQAGDVHDSGAAAGFIKSAYASLVELLATPQMARYVAVDLSEAGAEALLGGRFVAGLRNPFTYTFSWDWAEGYVDLSRRKKSAGGQLFIERDDRYRILEMTFDWVSEADRRGFLNEMDRINGMSRDILIIIDPASTDLTRDTIWGVPPDLSRFRQRQLGLFNKTLSIEERL